MKRKILSLALVLMMVISMIPMGAFAANPFVANTTASMYTSKVSADKTSVTGDYAINLASNGSPANGGNMYYVDSSSVTRPNYTASEVEFTVYTYTGGNTVAAGQKVYVVSSRDTEKFTTSSSWNVSGAVNDGVQTTNGVHYVTTDANGKATIKIASAVSGTAKIGFFLASDVNGETNFRKILSSITDGDINSTNAQLIATKDITFTADTAKGFSTSSPDKKAYAKKDVLVAVTGDNPNAYPKANNIEYYKLEYKLETATHAPVAGETVEFSSSDSAVTFDQDKVTTDGAGIATVKVYSTKSGSFTITAKNANNSKDTTVTYLSSGITNLTLATESGAKVANETTKKIKVKLLDSNGNQFKVKETTVDSGASLTEARRVIDVEVLKEPSGSSLVYQENGDGSAAGTIGTGPKDDYLRILVTPKKEGDYSLRIYLDNGKSVTYNFTSVKQGTVTGINLAYTQPIIPYGYYVDTDTLESKDANGITKDSNTNDIIFTSSDVAVATVETAGSHAGRVHMVDDDKNIGKTVTITATDKINKFSASYKLTVGGKLSTVKAVVPASAEAGKDANVDVQFVDQNGKMVGFVTTSASTSIDVDAYVIEKPAGATVSTEKSASFSGDMESNGHAAFFINSNKEGVVKVQLVVTLPDGRKMSDVATVTFGAKTDVLGGKGIILTIGNKVGVANGVPSTMDLAPFIKDGRAFVPVRFISEALGAKVEYTKTAAGLTDTVTLTQGTTVVTMKINDTNIKVVKAGVESKVTSDVAAMIKDGRTVLPFRALADALGAKATYGMKADNSGVEWVKFEQ